MDCIRANQSGKLFLGGKVQLLWGQEVESGPGKVVAGENSGWCWLPAVDLEECFAPVVLIEEPGGGAFENFQGGVEGFDGGESFSGVFEDF